MPIEIEVGVGDPDRVVQIERHAQRAPLERLDHRDALREIALCGFEAPRRARRGGEERDLERVLGLIGLFVVDELGVEARHSLHWRITWGLGGRGRRRYGKYEFSFGSQ
jgi:hypothetical protein